MEQVSVMKHASTKTVFAHWNTRRGARPAPARAEIDPVAIRHALGDTFILAADFAGELRFRLAGTRICALFCRELKGEAFGTLWGESGRESIEHLITVVNNENIGAVAGVNGRTASGEQADLELLLLPLAHDGPARVRALGVLAPAAPPYWLGEKPAAELALTTLRHLGSTPESLGSPSLAPAAEGSRIRRGFVVYSGGRTG